MAPWEKVFITAEALADVHLRDRACASCHGGNPSSTDKTEAHKNMKATPSYPDAAACSPCHDVSFYEKNIHRTLYPFRKRVMDRSGGNASLADAAMDRHCGSCHSSCGQCHVRRPDGVGGGLAGGHRFMKTPPAADTCMACHGSRVAAEFMGQNPGMEPDVHSARGMTCTDCHNRTEMHGDGKGADHRYAVNGSPGCIKCHAGIYTKSPASKTHRTHRGRVECHACHSQEYKNCFSCHVSMKEGKPAASTSPSRMDFMIGLNPQKSSRHPESFVVLRHVPAVPDAFDYMGRGTLGSFNSMSTWRLATPHNIRRKTPRNTNCNSCHGNQKVFLQQQDVDPLFRKANARVIVPPGRIPRLR